MLGLDGDDQRVSIMMKSFIEFQIMLFLFQLCRTKEPPGTFTP